MEEAGLMQRSGTSEKLLGQREPSLETESGGLRAERETGKRAPRCLGMRREPTHMWALLFSQAQGQRVAMG